MYVEGRYPMVDLSLRGQTEAAHRLLQAGDFLAALAICRRILEAFPRHVQTYLLLAKIYARLGQGELAADLWRRVLSADPENAAAWAGLAQVSAQRGLWDEARRQGELAAELAPGDEEILLELRRLGQAHSVAPSARRQLSRGALARIYLRGQLYGQAVRELRALVTEQPQRWDLRVALAEALWRDDRPEDAEAVCRGILAELPYCLKANLILGQLLLNGARDEEGRACLQRAQALDPENTVAQVLFGARSPLPPRLARLPWREEDAPPLELPYLVDDEEVVAEAVIIEGQARTPAPQAETRGTEAQPAPDAPAPTASGPQTTLPPEQPPTPAGPQAKWSLLDIQIRYVEENPDDAVARLDLARRLRASGQKEQALAHYRYLIEQDYALLGEVIRDLDGQSRLYPDDRATAELLRAARERERCQPKS